MNGKLEIDHMRKKFKSEIERKFFLLIEKWKKDFLNIRGSVYTNGKYISFDNESLFYGDLEYKKFNIHDIREIHHYLPMLEKELKKKKEWYSEYDLRVEKELNELLK